MLPESWNTTHHTACSFVFLGVPYKVVCSNSSESSDRKKKLLCCSVPGKASFPLDLCLHPCTWSFLHATCSFFCVFPSVWHFLTKLLPLPWQEASCAVAVPRQSLCHPMDSACCAESPGTPTAMDPTLDSPLFTSVLSEASLCPVFSKASAELDYLWLSCPW